MNKRFLASSSSSSRATAEIQHVVMMCVLLENSVATTEEEAQSRALTTPNFAKSSAIYNTQCNVCHSRIRYCFSVQRVCPKKWNPPEPQRRRLRISAFCFDFGKSGFRLHCNLLKTRQLLLGLFLIFYQCCMQSKPVNSFEKNLFLGMKLSKSDSFSNEVHRYF